MRLTVSIVLPDGKTPPARLLAALRAVATAMPKPKRVQG
jgi:hypothetical protein